MTDTTPESSPVPVMERDATDALLDSLEAGDVLALTKDGLSRFATVSTVLDGPYIIATDEYGTKVGFDRASIVHGIVGVTK